MNEQTAYGVVKIHLAPNLDIVQSVHQIDHAAWVHIQSQTTQQTPK
jgi:hypothetical protein